MLLSWASRNSLFQALPDNNCEFGKWLYGDPNIKKEFGARYDKVVALHGAFHKEVGRVLAMALAGKRDEAIKALEANTAFNKLSSELTREMLDWQKAA